MYIGLLAASLALLGSGAYAVHSALDIQDSVRVVAVAH